MPLDRPDPLATLAVLVVNFRTSALVEENLLRSLGPSFSGSVVVVDNFSGDGERRAIMEVCARHGWTCVPLENNAGFGGGINRAAAVAIEAGATELLALNPDAWLEIDGIRRLHGRVVEDAMLLVAPRVMRPNGGLYSDENDLYLDDGSMLWRHLRDGKTDPNRVHTWVSGACFLASAELWRSCGGFDDDYFLYWEDVDLSRRVVLAGGRVEVDRSVEAVHEEGASQRAEKSPAPKSPTYFYYNTRNRLLYAAKHLSEEDRRRWVRATPRLSYGYAKQGGRRHFVDPRRSLWPAFRGAWDGWRYLRRTSQPG